MRGKSNNIDVASLLFMVIIIVIIVSFLVNPVNIAGAGNWSEEKMGINRVLNKGESKGLISECDYEEIKEALDNANDLDSFIAPLDSFTLKINLDKVYHTKTFVIIFDPEIIRWVFGNERVNIYITLDNGSVLNFNSNIRGDMAELKTGKNPDPTINVYTSEHTLQSIVNSPDSFDAFWTALRAGDIKYEGVGIVNEGKLLLTKFIHI